MSAATTSKNEVVKIKNKVASQACNACKKRKVKCIGNPCAYCIKKNYVCQFNIGKKRGPPKKMRFPKGVDECGSMSVVLLNHIQSSMDEAYRQNNFVDFYFQYIGRPIDPSFKNALMSYSEQELNSDLITQLYIVSGHVMKFFGNSDLELQCIEKAQRYASNLFNCDTIESATALMMMANYVGFRHSKCKTYMNLALNITELPVLSTSVDAMKIKYAAKTLLTFCDEKLTTKQKYQYISEKIFALADSDATAVSVHVRHFDRIAVASIKIKYMLMLHGEYDDHALPAFIKTINSPATVVSAEHRLEMMTELEKMDNALQFMETNDSKYIFGIFILNHTRFIIEWRSGNTQEAIAAAVNSANIYNEHKNLLGLWFHTGFGSSLNLPYFLHIIGMQEKAQQLLDNFEQSISNSAAREELRSGWKELCLATGIYNIAQVQEVGDTQAIPMESSSPSTTSSSPSSSSPPSPSLTPPETPETLAISQSILQSFEQSISQHVAHPMSQILSPSPQTYYTEQNVNQQQQQQQQMLQQIQEQEQQQQQAYPVQYNTTQQNDNNMQTVYNFGVNEVTNLMDYNTNNNNNGNNNENDNNNSNNDFVLFDHDALSDLLFSPIMPVFSDILYHHTM